MSPPLAAASSPGWAVEVVGTDGMTVRCREGLSIEDLARLLLSTPVPFSADKRQSSHRQINCVVTAAGA